jgi:hypothetical protein
MVRGASFAAVGGLNRGVVGDPGRGRFRLGGRVFLTPCLGFVVSSGVAGIDMTVERMDIRTAYG